MELVDCPACFARVMLRQDGTCPACSKNVRDAPTGDPQFCQLLLKQIEPAVYICHSCGAPTERMARCHAEGGKEHGRKTPGILKMITLLISPFLGAAALATDRGQSSIVDVTLPQCLDCHAKDGKPKPLNVAYESMGMLFKVHKGFRDELLRMRAAAGASKKDKFQ